MSATNPSNRFSTNITTHTADLKLRYEYVNGSAKEQVNRCRGFIITKDGDMSITNDNGETCTFPVLKGMVIPTATDLVKGTTTTADFIVLY